VALATLLRSATELQYLDISNNDIDDEGIEALVPALANCSHSEELWIHDNPSITTRGWQRLLCDTTSVNATFLSNHSLSYLGDEIDENETIGYLLQLNCRNDKKEVATIKILKCHNDFDMLPFFQWEFKVLPLVLGWLERASECEMPDDFEPNIEGRKLSTIYNSSGVCHSCTLRLLLEKNRKDFFWIWKDRMRGIKSNSTRSPLSQGLCPLSSRLSFSFSFSFLLLFVY
jgi:hypothetical protein